MSASSWRTACASDCTHAAAALAATTPGARACTMAGGGACAREAGSARSAVQTEKEQREEEACGAEVRRGLRSG